MERGACLIFSTQKSLTPVIGRIYFHLYFRGASSSSMPHRFVRPEKSGVRVSLIQQGLKIIPSTRLRQKTTLSASKSDVRY